MSWFKHIFVIEKSLTKNKSYCIQLDTQTPGIWYFFDIDFCLFSPNTIFAFSINLFGDIFKFHISHSIRQDHAGFRFELTFFGLDFSFNIYDNRHWDYANNKWEVYDS